MYAVSLRTWGGNRGTEARGRTLENAIRNAGKRIGAPYRGIGTMQRFHEGGTFHVQFGKARRTGGMTLSDTYIGHVDEPEGFSF